MLKHILELIIIKLIYRMLEKDGKLRYNIDEVYSEMKRVHLRSNNIFEGTRKIQVY